MNDHYHFFWAISRIEFLSLSSSSVADTFFSSSLRLHPRLHSFSIATFQTSQILPAVKMWPLFIGLLALTCFHRLCNCSVFLIYTVFVILFFVNFGFDLAYHAKLTMSFFGTSDELYLYVVVQLYCIIFSWPFSSQLPVGDRFVYSGMPGGLSGVIHK